jgi:hypothetical protein
MFANLPIEVKIIETNKTAIVRVQSVHERDEMWRMITPITDFKNPSLTT